jgi:hypothetical protein
MLHDEHRGVKRGRQTRQDLEQRLEAPVRTADDDAIAAKRRQWSFAQFGCHTGAVQISAVSKARVSPASDSSRTGRDPSHAEG